MGSSCISGCKKCFGWVPVVFITAIVAWSYYAYVFQLCILTVPSIAEKVIYLILYHPIIVLFMWSYGKTIFVKHDHIPEEFYMSNAEHEAYMQAADEEGRNSALEQRARQLPVVTFTKLNSYRYCEKCRCIKPDRCHHCSMCERCILKMDHHCPWVNACVGYSNYKFFVLFLGYAELYCLYIAITTGQYFVKFWTSGGFSNGNYGQFHILFLFFVSFMFAISLTALFGYHIFLSVNNRSTLESFRAPLLRSGPDKLAFNLGKKQNFYQIFGQKSSLWFLPVFTSAGDGVRYPLRVGLQSTGHYEAVGYSSNGVNGLPEYSVQVEGSKRSSNGHKHSSRGVPSKNAGYQAV